jgi:hypothetical protein
VDQGGFASQGHYDEDLCPNLGAGVEPDPHSEGSVETHGGAWVIRVEEVLARSAEELLAGVQWARVRVGVIVNTRRWARPWARTVRWCWVGA